MFFVSPNSNTSPRCIKDNTMLYIVQGYGRSLWLMHGMFKANGGCGYIKKPDFLLKTGPHNDVFDPRAQLPVKQTLKVINILVPNIISTSTRFYCF